MTSDEMQVSNLPPVPNLTFRNFRGAGDFPGMAAVLVSSAAADGQPRSVTPDDLAAAYGSLTNCDPYLDMILAEVSGELVGYSRGYWSDDGSGRLYEIAGFLRPEWRRKGIGRTMLGWVEERLGALAASHPPAKARQFQVSARQGEEGLHALLQRSGYQPARYFDEMVRPDLEDVPDLSLPAGLELRPVQPDHYPAIWTCIDVTSRDEWGYRPQDAEDYKNWLGDEVRFQPELWQIAWEAGTGTVAGTVLTFIDHRENEAHGRTRGYTEGIGVIPGWRNRGVASTLIARSLFALKAVGMTEAALNVDTDNGSVRLYQRCGFYTVRRDIVYRKAL